MLNRRTGLAVGLLAGTVADAAFGDPRRGHPVAGFGRLAGWLEQSMWADSSARGAIYAGACVGGAVALGVTGERRAGPGYPLAVAVATWAVLGARSLRGEAVELSGLLEGGDLAGAREQLRHLVGRDPSGLDEGEITRAAVESLAENSSDAVVAPLLWGAIAGLPGLLGYRAVNTLDAMVGHRSLRYARFGWAAARLDDVVNLVPARVTALLVAAGSPAVGGRPGEVLRIVRRDGRRHPSPNAGFCEAAFAGALGLRLGGRNTYGSRVEERPVLGDGRAAEPRDLARAYRLAGLVTAGGAGLAAVVALRPRRST